MKPSDKITGRIFGQNITLQRCEWEAFAAGDADVLARAGEIAAYYSDAEEVRIRRDDFPPALKGGSYGGGSL